MQFAKPLEESPDTAFRAGEGSWKVGRIGVEDVSLETPRVVGEAEAKHVRPPKFYVLCDPIRSGLHFPLVSCVTVEVSALGNINGTLV